MTSFIEENYTLIPFLLYLVLYIPIVSELFFQGMKLSEKIFRAGLSIIFSPFSACIYSFILLGVIANIFPEFAPLLYERGIYRGLIALGTLFILLFFVAQLYPKVLNAPKGKATFVFLLLFSMFIILDTSMMDGFVGILIPSLMVLHNYYIFTKKHALIFAEISDNDFREVNKIQYSIVALQCFLGVLWNILPEDIAPFTKVTAVSSIYAVIGYCLYSNHVLVYEAAFKSWRRKLLLLKATNRNVELDTVLRHDELTGILNRRGFFQGAEELLQKLVLDHKEALVMYADIDNLKLINDDYGHEEGDYAIKALSKVLCDSFRDSDLIGRIGGDEFTVFAVVNEAIFKDHIRNTIENNIESLNLSANKPYRLQLTFGIHEFVCDETIDINDVLEKADKQLYEAKYRKERRS